MKVLSFSIFLLIFHSCVHQYELKPISPYYIFHQNSSKVWLINRLTINDIDYSPQNLNKKEILIFHHTKNCYLHKLSKIEKGRGKKASYFIDKSSKIITISFNSENWEFEINYINDEKIILLPTKKSKFKYKMELISLPEF